MCTAQPTNDDVARAGLRIGSLASVTVACVIAFVTPGLAQQSIRHVVWLQGC